MTITIICLIEALIIGYLLYPKQPVVPPDVPTIEIVRDSLIRDSIFIEIEKIKTEFIYVYQDFTQDSSDIMSASDSVLLSKFAGYIENYNNK